MRQNNNSVACNILAGAFLVHTFCHLLANFSVLYIVNNLKIYVLYLFIGLYILTALLDHSVISRNLKRTITFASCWGIIYLFAYLYSNYKTAGGDFVTLITGAMFFSFSRRVQEKCVHWFIIILAFICLLSAVEYVIAILTGIKVVIAHVQRHLVQGTQYFDETLFNVMRTEGSFPRFQSLTEEPGLLGTLCAFMLFVTGRIERYRYPFYIFLASTLLSFSLAGYILASCYLLTLKVKNVKVLVGTIAIGVLIAMYFGDFFQRLIYERLQTDDIDTRTNAFFDMHFYHVLESGGLWLGKGEMDYTIIGGNAGAKVWIYHYGVLAFGTLFCCYNYLFCSLMRKWTNFHVIFLLTFWMSFYQRATISEPYSILPFVGIALLDNRRKQILIYRRDVLPEYHQHDDSKENR